MRSPHTLTVQTPSGLAVTLTLGEYCDRSCVVRGAIPARGIEGAASCFRAEEAMVALAAFDSQHPEVLTGILEDEDRRAARAMFQ